MLLVRNPDPEEEEGEGSGGVQCQAAKGDPCRFHTPSPSRDATLMASDTNAVANSSKTASATSDPCRPLRVASSSRTSPTSSGSSGTQAKLRSSNQPLMTWGALKDQVKTPSLKQTEPSRPGRKKRRREEDEGEEAEAGLEEGRGGRGGQAVRRCAA